jgi:hypothetical protein
VSSPEFYKAILKYNTYHRLCYREEEVQLAITIPGFPAEERPHHTCCKAFESPLDLSNSTTTQQTQRIDTMSKHQSQHAALLPTTWPKLASALPCTGPVPTICGAFCASPPSATTRLNVGIFAEENCTYIAAASRLGQRALSDVLWSAASSGVLHCAASSCSCCSSYLPLFALLVSI